MIDILMATYNGEKYLQHQLDSILHQSNQDWRLIIRDDCSTDNTVELIKEYQLLRPEQIQLIQAEQPSGSAQNNFFQLLQYSTANYVMFADQDDVWLRQKVEATLDEMGQMEQQYGKDIPLLVHTDLAVVDENLRVLNHSLFDMHNMDYRRNKLNNILVQNIVTGCTVMVNRSLLNMITKTPEYAVMHDMWFALIAAAFGKIGFIDKTTMLYRQHGRNVKGARNMKTISYTLKKMRQMNEIHAGLVNQYRQAEEFLKLYDVSLSKEQKVILKDYASLKNSDVFRKTRVLTRHDLYKKGFIRKAGQILL